MEKSQLHGSDGGAAPDPSPPKLCAKCSMSIRSVGIPLFPSFMKDRVPAPYKSSRFRGVTKHPVTNRFEARLWDKDASNDKQKMKKKGKRIYLGDYKEEKAAAQAYDLAALKCRGLETPLNFKLEDYTVRLIDMAKIPKGEYLSSLRRKSNGFSGWVSRYKGVAK